MKIKRSITSPRRQYIEESGSHTRTANAKPHGVNHTAIPHPNDQEDLALIWRIQLVIETKAHKKHVL